jgi:hypothetical protein
MKTVCLMNLIKECAWSLNDKTGNTTIVMLIVELYSRLCEAMQLLSLNNDAAEAIFSDRIHLT